MEETLLNMNRLLAIFFPLLVIGCGDGLQRDVPSSARCSELRLETCINDGISIQTKGSVSGTTFPKNETMGLFVSCHDSTQTPPASYIPHQIGYNNIKAISTGTGWSFNNTVLNTTYSNFYVTSRSDSLKVDIYAYAPYIASVARPDYITFQHSQNLDLMWASENASLSTNKAIVPDGITKTVPLHFNHALCRLRFCFITENSGSNHYIDYIRIKKTGGMNTNLYKSGVFNAIDGTISNLVESGTDSLSVVPSSASLGNTNFSSNTAYTSFDVMLCETEVMSDDDLTVVFGIDGFRYSYTIKRSDVEHRDSPSSTSGNGTFGFKRGYSYTFKFLFDNYVHLKNIEIKSEWTPDTINVNI